MPISPTDRGLVERYMAAMQAGPEGEQEMVSLFGDDSEYIEPFSNQGQPTSHKGIAAIRQFFHMSFADPLQHQVKLTLDRLDMDGDRLRCEWTCEMPAMPGPFRGFDMYTIRDGKIQRLEITVTQPPAGA